MNDNDPRRRRHKYRHRGNRPALHWLAKQDPEGAWSVTAYERATDSGSGIYGDEDARFDDEYVDVEDDDPPPWGTGSDVDRVHGVRPSIEEMLADLLRVRVVRYADGTVHRVDGMATRPTFDGWQAKIGSMTFNYHPRAWRPAAGGFMVRYTDKDGRERQPKYDTSKMRNDAANDNKTNWCRISTGKGTSNRPPNFPRDVDLAPYNDVLELVLAGGTLKSIGTELGYGEHYADRGAKTAIRKAAAWAKERWPAPSRVAA